MTGREMGVWEVLVGGEVKVGYLRGADTLCLHIPLQTWVATPTRIFYL